MFRRDRPGIWTQGRWPRWLNEGKTNNLGVRFSQKLSTLEGLAGLAMITAVVQENMGGDLTWFCDNQGCVESWRHGTSGDIWLATVMKAIHDLCRGCGITLEVIWSPRMSGPGPRVSDALSKGDTDRAAVDWGEVEPRPRKIPLTLVKWIREPQLMRDLGNRILEELVTSGVKCEMLERVGSKPTDTEVHEMNKWYRLNILKKVDSRSTRRRRNPELKKENEHKKRRLNNSEEPE